MYRNLELEDIVVNDEVEVWVQINKVEELENIRDYYWVSNFGRIKSVGGREEKILKQADCNGYLLVGLQTSDGKQKMMRVHRLVALAFVSGWSEERNQANHINEVKTDNQASNLNWMTAKENSNHGTRNERVAEKQSMPVVGECVKTGKVIYFDSTAEAQRNGFHSGAISSACNGKRKTHKGFKWSYKESA